MKFAVCGGLGACIDFGTLWLGVQVLRYPEKIVFFFSTTLATIFVFFANRWFTFESKGQARSEILKFILAYSIAGFLNYLVSMGFFLLGVQYLLAKALAIGIIMFFNYFCLQRFVFRPSL